MTSHDFLLGVAGLVGGGGVCSASLATYLLGDAEKVRATRPRQVALVSGCVAVVGAVIAFRASG
jgi:hypothetical protein